MGKLKKIGKEISPAKNVEFIKDVSRAIIQGEGEIKGPVKDTLIQKHKMPASHRNFNMRANRAIKQLQRAIQEETGIKTKPTSLSDIQKQFKAMEATSKVRLPVDKLMDLRETAQDYNAVVEQLKKTEGMARNRQWRAIRDVMVTDHTAIVDRLRRLIIRLEKTFFNKKGESLFPRLKKGAKLENFVNKMSNAALIKTAQRILDLQKIPDWLLRGERPVHRTIPATPPKYMRATPKGKLIPAIPPETMLP